jgi:hypothetical protein
MSHNTEKLISIQPKMSDSGMEITAKYGLS